MMTKRSCLNATDAPHSDLPILSHSKSCLPLIFLLKTPWHSFFFSGISLPTAPTGTTDEPHWSHSTVMEMTSQLWPHLDQCGRTLVGIKFSQMW